MAAKVKSVANPGGIHPDLAALAVPLNDVHPHPRNARRGNILAIVESLRAHGQYKPIIVSKATGNVVAGNHTWKAARALEWETVAVDYRNLTPDEELRILTVDNRASDDSTYDTEALTELLAELAETEAGLAGTLYTDEDLADLQRSLDPYGSLADLDRPDDPNSGYQEQYGVIVICQSPADQEKVYDRLVDEGYECKVVAT